MSLYAGPKFRNRGASETPRLDARENGELISIIMQCDEELWETEEHDAASGERKE